MLIGIAFTLVVMATITFMLLLNIVIYEVSIKSIINIILFYVAQAASGASAMRPSSWLNALRLRFSFGILHLLES